MDTASQKAISQFLFVRNEPEPVDLAFVLGSPTVNSIYPALDMFRAGLTKKIIISGAGISIIFAPSPFGSIAKLRFVQILTPTAQ